MSCEACGATTPRGEEVDALYEENARLAEKLRLAQAEAADHRADLARLAAERLRLFEAVGKKTAEAVDALRDLRAMCSGGTGECGHANFPGMTCVAVRDKNGRCVFGCARENDRLRAEAAR